MKVIPVVLIFIICTIGYTQSPEYKVDVIGLGQVYSGEESPFWQHTNTRGRLDPKTNILGLISSSGTFELDYGMSVEFGAGALYKNGYDNELMIDQAYFSFRSDRIGVNLGIKHRQDLFQGLSATNQNILWSLNSAPPPGIAIFSVEPFFISGNSGIGFMGSLQEYFLNDERYVKNTRLHHKSFHIVYRNNFNFQISAGVQHFVQWAGISPEYGKLPNSFDDYLKVFTGSAGDPVSGEEVNALGNQLGSYEVNVKTKIRELDVEFIYNHIFEDGSGLKMGNFPDGRYGIFIEDNRDSFWSSPWFKAFMYEFYYTKNQSRTRRSSLIDGADNYFNNNLYQSGWTYRDQVMGTPFILLKDNRFRIGTNILAVHHFGLAGQAFEKYPYRFLVSYRQNYGVKGSFFPEKKEIISTLLEVQLIDSDYQLKAQLGADLKSNADSNIGIGLSFTKAIL